MSNFQLTYKPFGERSLLIEWPNKINENILNDVIGYKSIIEKYYIKQNIYIKSAYSSILITYDFTIENIYDEISVLKELYFDIKIPVNKNYKVWNIPVCYDLKFGIDLNEISIKNNLSKDQIISLHSNQLYTVFFIGFLPGFLYLGGLNKQLYVPRKSSPRQKIEKGSVAIGNQQTGVYPIDSPGGWNIIGNSPITFFNPNLRTPCFSRPGDKIRFIPIDLDEHIEICNSINKGKYQLIYEEING